MRLTERWLKKAEYYRRFARQESNLDFSDQAAQEMFLFESRGIGQPKPNNGYFRGRMLQDITVSLWKQDLKDGILFLSELFDDGYSPEFLHKVLL